MLLAITKRKLSGKDDERAETTREVLLLECSPSEEECGERRKVLGKKKNEMFLLMTFCHIVCLPVLD